MRFKHKYNMQMTYKYCIASLLGYILVAGNAHAAENTHAPLQPLPPPALAASEQLLDLRRWDAVAFHNDYSAIVRLLGETHGSEKEDVLLNTAELYLSHMLLYEAGSVLAGIEPGTLAQKGRHRALSDAATLLGGEAVGDFARSPLNEDDRNDRMFWQTLQAIALADAALLASGFEQSFVGLGEQSPAVLRAMLPVFAEAAIELGNLRYADATLRIMHEFPGTHGSTTDQFLIGRAEEKRGNDASALEAYFQAAKGWDKYAVRARLAVADMALESGSQGALLAAENTLFEGRESWRGGQFELAVFERLVAVQKALEKDEAHLLTLGQLIARFPNADNMPDKLHDAEELLSKIYEKGAQGGMAIAEWMDLHGQLLPLFRNMPGFPVQTERLADYLAELGATDLAALEYRRAIQLIESYPPTDPAQTDVLKARLGLKLARSELQGGLAAAAQETLEHVKPATPAQNDELVSLKAMALAELEEWTALAEAPAIDDTPRHHRDRSKALAEEGQWQKSSAVLLQFWDKHPETFNAMDAALLLVAANRSGDLATRDRVIRSFPSLSENKPLIELAKGMRDDIPRLEPLRIDAASARLERLEIALEDISASQLSDNQEDAEKD